MQASDQQPLKWFGIHLGLGNPQQVQALLAILPALKHLGVNLLIAEVNYNFTFESHPELRGPDPISKADVQDLAAACRRSNIRLVPQFMCLGHQSWAKQTFPLLVQYPQLDETPGQYPGNEGIYCRSWCPRHPDLYPLVFDLMDELLEAFQADAFHVGMDEVFLIASESCPRCRGADPGEIFATAVADLHSFLVGERGVQMMMWGDRLLDDSLMEYGEWEASQNGTHTAIGSIPRDIIQVDWHYELRQDYPSIPFLLQQGFQVLPAGWRQVEATQALLKCEVEYLGEPGSEGLLGHLCTTWGAVQIQDIPTWAPVLAASRVYGSHSE